MNFFSSNYHNCLFFDFVSSSVNFDSAYNRAAHSGTVDKNVNNICLNFNNFEK